jgi:hypothetical protein
MDVQANYSLALETLNEAKARNEAAKTASEKETKEAEEANQVVTDANSKVTDQNNIYIQADAKVTTLQTAYDNAVAVLNSLQEGDDEAAIQNAQAQVDSLLKELQAAEDEAKRQYDLLVAAQQDAATALKKYEIEKQESEAASKELEDSEAALKEAEEAFAQAEEELAAAEAEETEEVTTPNSVGQMTEAEAIAAGYTVIKSAAELQAIANNLSGKYILMCDIDLSGVEWEPIGYYNPSNIDNPFGQAFSGELNGNGYSIKNLTVVADSGDNAVGLFGATNGATIKNLILADANVSASTDYNETAVGALIGRSRDTNIDNVAVTGSVTGHQGVGGVIGVEMDSDAYGKVTISNVTSDVNVNASFYAGGLIGKVNGTARNSLVIEDCYTTGNMVITDQAGGGLIGEAGKTVVTVNRCDSSMNITKTGEEDTELSWLLDDTSRIGGIIGNCNGTYISICNSNYTGTLNCEDEFKGDYYGWYMNDAQVSIFELSAGLPADDILNIDGIESITPIVDPSTGVAHYEITVSTLAGMNRIVDMIQNNPDLAELITFNIQFDFETMDEAYDKSGYSQYGVVQHLYEDSDGNVVNSVYIDNEIDLETTFNVTGFGSCSSSQCDAEKTEVPEETMVAGLYKDSSGKYYVYTPGTTNGAYEGFTEVSLAFFFANQSTIVTKRLDSDEVELRQEMVDTVYEYQDAIFRMLYEQYGWDYDSGDFVDIMQEPEYKALKKRQAAGETLSNEELLKLSIFELNYTIMNIVSDITNNKGCGMGGNASFLEASTGTPLEDEWGRTRYQNLDGLELRQCVDENGELMYDAGGNPLFETLDGESYDTSRYGEAYVVRGYQVTDDDGNFLYTDADGNTVTRKTSSDGSYTYTYEDGSAYNGETSELTNTLKEYSPSEQMDDLYEQMDALYDLYKNGGAVDPSKENNGVPTTSTTASTDTTETEEQTEDDIEKKLEEEV